jgi:hypothetical protein
MSRVHPIPARIPSEVREPTRHDSKRVTRQSIAADHVLGILTGHVGDTPYSLGKFLALDDYARSTSRWRIAAVIVGTPLPSLATLLLVPFIPLRDPTVHPLHSPGVCAHFVLVVCIIVFGALLHGRGATQLTSRDFPTHRILFVALLVGLSMLGCTVVVATLAVPCTIRVDHRVCAVGIIAHRLHNPRVPETIPIRRVEERCFAVFAIICDPDLASVAVSRILSCILQG